MSQENNDPGVQPSWEQRYIAEDVPWDSDIPDYHLRHIFDTYDIPRGRALDIGCGTGTNVIWLAEQGFAATGLDVSETAIARAEHKAGAAGVDCDLRVRDFLNDEVPEGPYTFAYDRGCFHVFSAEERDDFARRVAGLLETDGIWHSLMGSTDGPPRDSGPPRISAIDIAAAVEPHLEILELRSTFFDQGQHSNHRAWVLVARRR